MGAVQRPRRAQHHSSRAAAVAGAWLRAPGEPSVVGGQLRASASPPPESRTASTALAVSWARFRTRGPFLKARSPGRAGEGPGDSGHGDCAAGRHRGPTPPGGVGACHAVVLPPGCGGPGCQGRPGSLAGGAGGALDEGRGHKGGCAQRRGAGARSWQRGGGSGHRKEPDQERALASPHSCPLQLPEPGAHRRLWPAAGPGPEQWDTAGPWPGVTRRPTHLGSVLLKMLRGGPKWGAGPRRGAHTLSWPRRAHGCEVSGLPGCAHTQGLRHLCPTPGRCPPRACPWLRKGIEWTAAGMLRAPDSQQGPRPSARRWSRPGLQGRAGKGGTLGSRGGRW